MKNQRTVILSAATCLTLSALACTASTTSSGTGGPAPGPQLAASTPSTSSSRDPRLQAIAEDEIDRTQREWSPAASVVLILDPSTGEIVAHAGRDHGAPADIAVARAYVTGSTLKAITLAAALEENVISPSDRIDCEGGKWTYDGKTLQDHAAFGVLSVPEMLAVSTNVGFAKMFDRLGGSRLDHWLRAFHFGAAPPVEGATAGVLGGPLPDRSFAGAVTAIGEKMTASPLQVAAAYAALANGGAYVPPTATRRAGEAPREQLVRAETARTVVTMLEGVVTSENGTGSRARVDGVRVAGKTGTASWERPDGSEGIYASFVGFVPSNAPRFVILVGVEQPRDGEGGATVAAPAFARVATRALSAK